MAARAIDQRTGQFRLHLVACSANATLDFLSHRPAPANVSIRISAKAPRNTMCGDAPADKMSHSSPECKILLRNDMDLTSSTFAKI
jgi:hypothetical protein